MKIAERHPPICVLPSFCFRLSSHIFVVYHHFDYGQDENTPCKSRSCRYQVFCSSVEQTLATLHALSFASAPRQPCSRHPLCPPAHRTQHLRHVQATGQPQCLDIRPQHYHHPSRDCEVGTSHKHLAGPPWLLNRLSTSTPARSCTTPSHHHL
jgi:hypothetical protein